MDIFCNIIADQSQRPFLYEDDEMIILPSIHPLAEQHFLVIPKRHIQSIVESEAGDEALVGKMIFRAKTFAAGQGITDFKLLFNAGKYVEVTHLHLHILCGQIKTF